VLLRLELGYDGADAEPANGEAGLGLACSELADPPGPSEESEQVGADCQPAELRRLRSALVVAAPIQKWLMNVECVLTSLTPVRPLVSPFVMLCVVPSAGVA